MRKQGIRTKTKEKKEVGGGGERVKKGKRPNRAKDKENRDVRETKVKRLKKNDRRRERKINGDKISERREMMRNRER